MKGMRAQHFLVLGALAVVCLLYTTYHQQHRLSHALHLDHIIRDDGRVSSNERTDWHAVWAVANASGSEAEFLAAMHSSGHGSADNILLMQQQQAQQQQQLSCPPQRECPACSPANQSKACGGTTAKDPAGGGTGGGAAVAVPPPPVSWTMFLVDGQVPQISKELAQSVAKDGAVIVTWANFALWDFVQTWIFHAKAAGLSNFLVGAMDARIGGELVAAHVPCFAMYEVGANHSGVGSDHLQWGGEAFHKMGRQKITLAQLFLGLGLDLLLVDVDVMLLDDVMEYFKRYPQADVLVTSDQLASSLEPGDTGLELPDKAQAPMNIGLMYFRYSQHTATFVDTWLALINADPKYWDQLAFNDLVRQGWDPVNKVHPNEKRVFVGANGTLSVGVLPVASFAGGHTFFVQRMYEVQRVKPYAVHCTFQYGANPGKRSRLREAILFYDQPSYYTDDLYVSVELRRVPSATWAEHSARNNSFMKRYHFRGLNMQLETVWPALRVAAVTNRALIVPKLACYCDRYWTELDQCKVPGAFQTRVPFLCPMDHVLDPIFMDDDDSSFKVRWREHSFLENPRCPDWVKQSRVTFYSSANATQPTEKWVVQEGGLVVVLPAKLTEGQIREVLKPYSAYKVWHLKDPEKFFGGFDDKKLEEAVDVRIQHLQPVMPPDPAPPPPPGADNSTAPGVSSQIQTTAQNETSVAAADGNMGTGKDAAGSSVVGGQDTATSTVIDGATADATLVNTTQAGYLVVLPER